MTISAPTNPALFLEDGLTAFAPTGGGTFTRKGLKAGLAYVYDTGADGVPKSFVAGLQASVLDLSSGNEQYVVTIEGGNAVATDGDGNVSLTGEVRGLDEWSMSVVDQQDVRGFSTLDPLDNTLWRYIRLSIQVSGTTPQIAMTAFIRPLSDMEAYEFHELIQLQVFTAENIQNAIACWLPWANGVAGGGPNSDGKYPIYDGFGHSYLLACPRQWSADFQVDVPLSFGAIGGPFSHPASEVFDTLADCQAVYPFATSLAQEMDFLAMQKAWNTGRKIGSPPIPYKMCNADPESQTNLTCVAGLTWVEAAGARLNFSALGPKTSDDHFVDDYGFALTSGTPWMNAATYDPGEHDDATFGSGEAACIDTRTDGSSPFFQFGQEVTLSPGRYTATCTYEASRGVSYDHGNPTVPTANLAFFADSPGVGANFSGRGQTSRPNVAAADATDTVTMTFDFEVTEEVTSWYTLSAYGWADWHVTDMDIVPALLNCAVLMTRDGAPEHYPIMQPLSGLWIEGPGVTGVTGVLWKSFTNLDGNVASLRLCNTTGFDYALETSDGAYLVEIDHCNEFGNQAAYRHRPGSYNAGENIRFTGGGIFNNGVGIDNIGGAEITLDKTALDFCTQLVINNNGRIECTNVHCETNTPTDADKPLWHLIGGQFTMFGGMILIAGTPYTSPCAMIKSEYSTAVFEVFGTEPYNLSSDPNGAGKGAIMEGPGRFISHGIRNSGNPNLGPLCVSYAPVMDALSGAGLMPEPNAYTADPNGILIEGGAFPDVPGQIPITASISGSVMTLPGAPPFQIYEGMRIKGPGVKGEPLVSFIDGGGTGWAGTYRVSVPQTLSERGLTVGKDAQIDRWNTDYGTLEWSDDHSIDGGNCLKFTKNNDGLNSELRFLFPAQPGAVAMGFMKFLFPVDYAPVDPEQTVPLYYRLRWVRSIGTDSYRRPVVVKEWETGNETINVLRAGSMTPVLRTLNTTHSDVKSDPADEASTRAPEGTTHLAVFIGTQSLPAGQVLYMNIPILNFLR
ncbi:hypothetical protein [Asticcacaulis sp.]|uniref:hypothetical protein n=1 Tax=Asticcacaulis sp. TaxID=1872648 RepID=UPI003F7BAB48